jgi:elongation factor P
MYETRDFKKNLKIEIDGVPYIIVDFQHISPGKGAAFTRVKIKNLITGQVLEKNIKSGDKVDVPNLENFEVQFLYKDGDFYTFMNTANYEQITLDEKILGESKNYLKENVVCQVMYFNGNPIGIDLPTFIEAVVVETEPAVKGNTVSGNVTKNAKIDTGANVAVPLFIKEGDLIKVDTRDGSYVEKINK